MPQYARLSDAECSAIHVLRTHADNSTRKAVKREIFARAKVAFSIPPAHKMLVDVDLAEANHGVLRNKATREPYELNDAGKWVNGANADAATKRWFKLDQEFLHEAIVEALDSADASGNNIVSQPNKPTSLALTAQTGTDGDASLVLVDNGGNLWVQLDQDAYGSHDDQDEEEDDDNPY